MEYVRTPCWRNAASSSGQIGRCRRSYSSSAPGFSDMTKAFRIMIIGSQQLLDEARESFILGFMPSLKSLFVVLFLAGASAGVFGAELTVPDNIVFQSGVEYANPDGQHLQLNIAQPKNAEGLLPCVLCIHGG